MDIYLISLCSPVSNFSLSLYIFKYFSFHLFHCPKFYLTFQFYFLFVSSRNNEFPFCNFCTFLSMYTLFFEQASMSKAFTFIQNSQCESKESANEIAQLKKKVDTLKQQVRPEMLLRFHYTPSKMTLLFCWNGLEYKYTLDSLCAIPPRDKTYTSHGGKT